MLLSFDGQEIASVDKKEDIVSVFKRLLSDCGFTKPHNFKITSTDGDKEYVYTVWPQSKNVDESLHIQGLSNMIRFIR